MVYLGRILSIYTVIFSLFISSVPTVSADETTQATRELLEIQRLLESINVPRSCFEKEIDDKGPCPTVMSDSLKDSYRSGIVGNLAAASGWVGRKQ